MTVTIASRITRIQPSSIFRLAARAEQLKAEGQSIINLTIGEPDFDTPEFIKMAAREALANGFTKYTAVDGIPTLKRAIIAKLSRDNQLTYTPKQIIVTNGAKQAIYNLIQALLNPGDEVIIPAPYWVSYPEMVLLAESQPIILPTGLHSALKITPDQLAGAITPKTRLLILNSPANPTGAVYTIQELEALAQILLRHRQVVILSDDIYEYLYWGQQPACVNILQACPALSDRTVLVNGVSKTYAMTGWRIGYAAGPAELITAMATIQSQSTSNPNSIAQVAAQAALEGDQQCVQTMKQAYYKRHQLLWQGLQQIPGITGLPADGAFYSFPSVEGLLGSKLANDYALADYLLETAGVATVPGSVFGSPGYLRFSCAVDIAILETALAKLKAALNSLP